MTVQSTLKTATLQNSFKKQDLDSFKITGDILKLILKYETLSSPNTPVNSGEPGTHDCCPFLFSTADACNSARVNYMPAVCQARDWTLLPASSSSFLNPYKVDIIVPISEMRKMKCREVKSITHDLTDSE